ncbi:MAG: undecaprenyldiphospho-muramoylpentapeptide beta-N-acetylglucosaminyltransferase [Alphaproteobacteria bacterium]|nr:undecaprenyldiphospho-muramoylpentapeptide beta-N-acetylglucosaminyltransferase [Alphaproteobacteria bacterium]
MSTILLATGGTGGHLFPATALAEVLLRRGHTVALATDARGRTNASFDPRIQVVTIESMRPTRHPLRALAGMAALARGAMAAHRLLRSARPQVAVGFGGHASLPAMILSLAHRVPILLHEQNAVLGRANRLLARQARALALSFAEVARLRPEDRAKARLTGNPVRAAIAAIGERPYAAAGGGRFGLLVTGGSLGARVFSALVPAAIALLPATVRQRLAITQQCRAEDIDAARAAYRACDMEPELAPFFSDMPARLAAAALVICRSGASTTAELLAAGRPALLVPYPHAADDHQTANAQALDAAGAGWILSQTGLTPAALATRLATLIDAPATLARAAQCARAAARPDAAERLADLVEEQLAGAKGAPGQPLREAAE